MAKSPDARRFAPATERNRGPILDVLHRYLPSSGVILEIASGSGEHVMHFAEQCGPELVFQPSDPDPTARESISAWMAGRPADAIQNVRPPIDLDAEMDHWPVTHADVVICINMIHISPWTATIGLMRGAARIIPAGGVLYLYGPFRRLGWPTAASNEAFDDDLRARNSMWGLRDFDTVVQLARKHGFRLHAVEEMPANNLSVLLRRVE